MDSNGPRGRSPLRGNNHHISPDPSPNHFRDAVSGLGLDPSIDPQTFTTGKFNSRNFSNPFLDQTQSHSVSHPNGDETDFYTTNQFNHTAYQENQFPVQAFDPQFANEGFLFENNNMHGGFDHTYSLESCFNSDQQQNINPADLSRMSSPHIPQSLSHSPSLLPPESHISPRQPVSPTSTQGQYYTPQHSRHQSLDPASAGYPLGDWQGLAFQGHRRVSSEHSDISSNAPSPFLPQHEVFESIESNHSPFLTAQQDGGNTFGIDNFTLAEQPNRSPHHSPYISPHIIPDQNHGLGMDPNTMLGHNHGGVPGPELYAAHSEEPYSITQMHIRNQSTVSDLGRADQFATPSINIEPAPLSRQPSFEPDHDNEPATDALSPPQTKQPRGRSKSDITFSRPSRSVSPTGRSPPHLGTDTYSVRSLSPGLTPSRDSSPGPLSSGRIDKNRRSSTSSIASRDYILDLADPSRPTAAPNQSTRVQKHPATFQCTLCPKRFTRAYNLRSHLRTHTDERPFVCTVCGKAFARQHDRKRHEGLHSGEKKFVCRGELGGGGQWGCGRRFARADALGRHFRSEAGRACIKPLLDEEAAERARMRMLAAEHAQAQQQQQQQHPHAQYPPYDPSSSGGADPGGLLQPHTMRAPLLIGADPMGNGGFSLPAALLAQYPQLTNIDWSSIPQGDVDVDLDQDLGELSDVGGMGGGGGGQAGYAEDDEDGGGYQHHQHQHHQHQHQHGQHQQQQGGGYLS